MAPSVRVKGPFTRSRVAGRVFGRVGREEEERELPGEVGGEGGAVARLEVGERNGELVLDLETGSSGIRHTDAQHGIVAPRAEAEKLHVVFARHAHDHATSRLREQGDGCVHAVTLANVAKPHSGPNPEPKHRLGKRLSEAAIAEVVRAVDQRLLRRGMQQSGQRSLATEVDEGWAPTEVVVHDVGPGRTVKLEPRAAE